MDTKIVIKFREKHAGINVQIHSA